MMFVIAIPGLPFLYSDPDMCPWMLVVVYYLVCILFTGILSFRMCWAGLFQVGCVWEPSVAAQIFWTFARARSWSLERELSSCLVGRARVASLERALAPGSGPESCISWLERAGYSSLERAFCLSSVRLVTDLRV